MGNWYYLQNGQQLGPAQLSDLRILAANGELAAGDLVWQEGMDQWIAAGQVPGLFVAERPTQVAQPMAAQMAASSPVVKRKTAGKKGPPLILLVLPIALIIAGWATWRLALRETERQEADRPHQAAPADSAQPTPSGDTGDLATRIYNIGLKSLHGDGVPQDTDKGIQLLHQAAQLGNVDAMTALGSAYEHGTGVAADPAAAKKWYDRAAAKAGKQ